MVKPAIKLFNKSRSLRPQLNVAFCVMSVIPILALLGLLFPCFIPRDFILLMIGAIIVLSLLGFLLMKRIIDPIVHISSEVKEIAGGELTRSIQVTRDDEIGELGTALNQLTQHIKNNMDELKIYGERTKTINLQINKQVAALSGLFEISNLITGNAPLQDIFDIAISRFSQIARSTTAFVIIKSGDHVDIPACFGLKADSLSALKMPANGYIFDSLLRAKEYFKIDGESPAADFGAEFVKILNLKNLLFFPVIVRNQAVGMVGIGNQEDDFSFSSEDVELAGVFAKQLCVAVENDVLSKKVMDLEVRDELTGLYNRHYIFVRLQEEILRAIMHQRPCGFVVFKIGNFGEIRARFGDLTAEADVNKIADVLRGSGSDMDRAGYFSDGVFGMVLPEKNKMQAQTFALRTKEKILTVFVQDEVFQRPDIDFVVVENPIDGTDAAILFEKAGIILGQHRRD